MRSESGQVKICVTYGPPFLVELWSLFIYQKMLKYAETA